MRYPRTEVEKPPWLRISKRIEPIIQSWSGDIVDNHSPENVLVNRPDDENSRWTAHTSSSSTNLLVRKTTGVPGSSYSTSTVGLFIGKHDEEPLLPEYRISLKGGVSSHYLVFDFLEPRILTEIGFGKFVNTHPCNVNEFAVYGGLTPDRKDMDLLLFDQLSNYPRDESFTVDHRIDPHKQEPKPLRYVSLEPLSGHASSAFNLSFWYVWFSAFDDDTLVQSCLDLVWSTKVLRLSKELASMTNQSGFLSLPRDTLEVYLENGDFVKAESTLFHWYQSGRFDEWGNTRGTTRASWQCLKGPEVSSKCGEQSCGIANRPSPRSGHQIAVLNGNIYLHGGYDGTQEFGDLWVCQPDSGQWTCIYDNTDGHHKRSGQGHESLLDSYTMTGPKRRSCHKLVADPVKNCLYLLGRYVSYSHSSRSQDGSSVVHQASVLSRVAQRNTFVASSRELDSFESSGFRHMFGTPLADEDEPLSLADFWRYVPGDPAAGPSLGHWERISSNTLLDGGPPTVFDHEMCIDAERQLIFVFGGACHSEQIRGDHFASLYVYDIVNGRWWTGLDALTPEAQFVAMRRQENDYYALPPGRSGHCMVLLKDTLYIFSGIAGKPMTDLWVLKIRPDFESTRGFPPISGVNVQPLIIDGYLYAELKNRHISKLLGDSSSSNFEPPPTGFCQRAVANHAICRESMTSLGSFIEQLRKFREGFFCAVRPFSVMASGLQYMPGTGTAQLATDVWVLSYRGAWSKVFIDKHSAPPPRYAAPLTFDPVRSIFYMHGGVLRKPDHMTLSKDTAPGAKASSSILGSRGDDIWALNVHPPTPEKAFTECLTVLRLARLMTLPPQEAFSYIDAHVAPLLIALGQKDEIPTLYSCGAAPSPIPIKTVCDTIKAYTL